MALVNKKLTELTEKVSAPNGSFIHFVDPTDISQSPEGSSFKIKKENFIPDPDTDFLSNDISTYSAVTPPISATDLILINQGGTWKKVEAKDINIQVYKTISGNVTIDNTYHNAIVWIDTTCNVTIPAGLRSDFVCNAKTLTGVTASYLTSGTVINTNSDGDVQAPLSMVNIATFSTNNFMLSGGGLS